MEDDEFALREIQSDSADGAPVFNDEIDYGDVAEAPDRVKFAHLAAQGSRHRGTGIEKINVAAALSAMPRRYLLFDATIRARPARAPLFHLKDALGPVIT